MLRAQRRDPAKAQAKCAFATNYPLANRQLRSPLILRYRMQRDKPFPRLFRAVDAQISHIILALPDRGTVFDDVFSARLMKARGDRFARLVGM